MAAAAHQEKKLLSAGFEAEHAGARVLGRNERRAADAARLLLGRGLMSQGDGDGSHYRQNTLKAWVHEFWRKPEMHQSCASGSIARAAIAPPMSAASQPN